MKVLYVLNHFMPKQVAGTEIYTWALSKHLQKSGVKIQIVIPNYGSNESKDYIYDNLNVHLYAEPSEVNRSLIMGFRNPDGLINFVNYLKNEKPDIVHFHELAGSNGISLSHMKSAKQSGAKVLMTFHLAGYSCKTGTLHYNGDFLCDGIINPVKCGKCYLRERGFANVAPCIVAFSNTLKYLSINSSNWNSKIGTALSIVTIISKLRADLHDLVNLCEKVIVISDWYGNILKANGIDSHKIMYIPQGLPLSKVETNSSSKNISTPLKLIFIGRISKFKGLHILIEALKDIDSGLVQLSIYGNSDDPVYESMLRTQTKNCLNIAWCGSLLQNDVVDTMSQHDVLCLCSTFSEMSPLVIQEAFAARLPVIASNVYGNAEQISHGENGLLFKFNDAKDLRKQILKCIDNPDLIHEMSMKICPPRTFKDLAFDYLDLYKSILN